MTELLGRVFAAVLYFCHSLTGGYGWAIILFTLLTKVLLFPVSCWVQKNGITMVRLMPELNRIKIKYFGDQETIGEETQKLYKRENYKPLLTTLPMIIQLVLLFGVIGAVRICMADADSALTLIPSEAGGLSLLMPLAAGLAAVALGLAQNRFNPLQREQSKSEQWFTNGISIAISLVLGAFVPLGTGIYWIASNLFSILQQLLLNAVIPAEKYVDYEALAESRDELNRLNALTPEVSREDKRREKADYKRFFSVANKHIVFYSESSGFYKYFKFTIEYMLAHSNVTIHYVTSDPADKIFDLAEKNPRIRAYYIGEKRLITLMMKMDADIVVMTMPDLGNFHIKRSYVRKDIEYIYMFHGVFTSLRTLRPGALDNFDTLLTVGDYQEEEIRREEQRNGKPEKKLVPNGYCVIDDMARAYEEYSKGEGSAVPRVLIAPSWQEDNILESCLVPLAASLLEKGYSVTVRPHPQYLRRFPQKFEQIRASCAGFDTELFAFETDFSSNSSVFTADILITDWSGIGFEYALSTKRPALFVNTPMKVVNEDLAVAEGELPFDIRMRSALGIALEPEEVGEKAGNAAVELLKNADTYRETITEICAQHIHHFGDSGKYSARYILGQLKNRRKEN